MRFARLAALLLIACALFGARGSAAWVCAQGICSTDLIRCGCVEDREKSSDEKGWCVDGCGCRIVTQVKPTFAPPPLVTELDLPIDLPVTWAVVEPPTPVERIRDTVAVLPNPPPPIPPDPCLGARPRRGPPVG